MEPTPANGPGRVVLIDLDWQEVDLLPEILRRLGPRMGLVAGADDQDAGVRVADLCGVRRTIDLSDLTREIFDVALVGEGSRRRRQIERLLEGLGTPILSSSALREWVRGERSAPPQTRPEPRPAPALPEDLDAALFRALPDLDREPSDDS